MAGSLNVVVLVGNLTRDPELRYTPGGTAVTTLALAVNNRVKQGEEWKEEPCFVDVTVFGRQAETSSEYLSKGSQVLIEGQAGIDIALVGDSLAMVVQGIDNTLPVTMDEMIYHTRLVSRAVKTSLVVGDMPFLSYQAGIDDAVRNAGRFLKEAGAEAVKLEGGTSVAGVIRAIVAAGIPVMGPTWASRPSPFTRSAVTRSRAGTKLRGKKCLPTRGQCRRLELSVWCSKRSRPLSPERSVECCPSRLSASAPARTATARCS